MSTERLSSAEYLLEHCQAPGCANGLVKRLDGTVGLCALCNGSTRRLRHTHDPRSAIDFEEVPPGQDAGKATVGASGLPSAVMRAAPEVAEPISPETLHVAQYGASPFYAALPVQARLAELVAAHPNDADLGAAVRELFAGGLHG